MIKINLLPHREARRRERRTAFVALMVFSVIVGAMVVMLVGGVIANRISDQNQRNDFIKAENAKLDIEIKEIASLRQEIEGLIARQRAVEDLQSDRNQPVYLMDELVKQVPEGIYLRSFKQAAQRVVIDGYAQSNERVSELLRNLGNNSPWLERPDLVEIRSTQIGTGKDQKKVFDFTVNVGIKRPRDQEAAAAAARAAVPGGAAGSPATGAVAGASVPAVPAATGSAAVVPAVRPGVPASTFSTPAPAPVGTATGAAANAPAAGMTVKPATPTAPASKPAILPAAPAKAQ
ncbi:MAG: PilN domain-containing protein [Janthinobacterium lividum]